MAFEEKENEEIQNDGEVKNAIGSAKSILNKKNKDNQKQLKWIAAKEIMKHAGFVFILQAFIASTSLILIVLFISVLVNEGKSSKAKDENKKNASEASVWGCNLTRDEFIEAAKSYNAGTDYQTYLAAYAGNFYDVCTKYNVNPCYAYGHSMMETGNGSSTECKRDKNYFGYMTYNGQDHGKAYATVDDALKDYCEWIVDASTEGTDLYNKTNDTGKKYKDVNDKFNGTSDNNIYVLFCVYAYLGDNHVCDEPDFDNPLGIEGYKKAGNTWGHGGRIMIYSIYEAGGLYTGRYKELCGHSNASDPTTLQEQADYAQYTVERRIKLAKAVFGEKAFKSSSGSFESDDIVENAIKCHEYLRTNGYTYAMVGIEIPDGVTNGKTIDCSSYVSWVLYCTGYENLKGHQQTSYTFNQNPWKWEEVSVEDAVPGDILVYQSSSIQHVEIVAANPQGDYFTVYSCGSNGAISNPGTTELPEAGYPGYSKSQVTRILRPAK